MTRIEEVDLDAFIQAAKASMPGISEADVLIALVDAAVVAAEQEESSFSNELAAIHALSDEDIALQLRELGVSGGELAAISEALEAQPEEPNVIQLVRRESALTPSWRPEMRLAAETEAEQGQVKGSVEGREPRHLLKLVAPQGEISFYANEVCIYAVVPQFPEISKLDIKGIRYELTASEVWNGLYKVVGFTSEAAEALMVSKRDVTHDESVRWE